jgi:hypothetical protein
MSDEKPRPLIEMELAAMREKGIGGGGLSSYWANRLLATLDEAHRAIEARDRSHKALELAHEQLIERAEKAERMQASSYELLKAYDNYGSGDVSTCYREMLRILTADHPQEFTKLEREVEELVAKVMAAEAQRDAAIERAETGIRLLQDIQEVAGGDTRWSTLRSVRELRASRDALQREVGRYRAVVETARELASCSVGLFQAHAVDRLGDLRDALRALDDEKPTP